MHARAVCQILMFVAASGALPRTALSAASQLPSFETVEKALLAHFQGLSGYREGDLISRRPAKDFLDRLEKLGWKPIDQDAILNDVPEEGDFVVSVLSTTRGKSFMRKISKYPNAYDRLDRLGRLPQGKQTVRQLINGPGGYQMIEYLTSSSGGKELGKMLSRSPQGGGFNQPTGKLYTASHLLTRLRRSYGDEIAMQSKR